MRWITPGAARGTVEAPGSKSVAQRALLAAACAPGESVLRGVTACDDVLAGLDVARALGADVELSGRTVRVRGRARPRAAEVSCRESGTTLRLAAAVAALEATPLRLLAEGSLARRPLAGLAEALTAFGARVDVTDGSARALTVAGPLRPGAARLDGSASSQPLSGLMLALPQLPGPSRIRLEHPASVRYLDLTAEVAGRFGLDVTRDGDELTTPGGCTARPAELTVPGDWSGAAFLLVAGALTGAVSVTGLDPRSTQPDAVVLDVLRAAGARVCVAGERVDVAAAPLRPFAVDCRDSPDAVPPLIVLATGCAGTSRITGALRLRGKESDRAVVLAAELGQLGARVRVDGDVIEVGGGPLHGGEADPHGDHRMAMAAAVCGLRASAPVGVHDPGCVAKSYPGFFADLERITA